jgi:hypothetical protein
MDAAVHDRRAWLDRIWNEHLGRMVGSEPFAPIVPISKKDLIAMDPRVPRAPGSEPLDMKLVRAGAGSEFDAAIVAWDLQPQWNGMESFCRWNETLRFYELLGASRVLPDAWRRSAVARRDDYASRPHPGSRPRPPRLERGAVFPLCMDPEFESLLTADEAALKRALAVTDRIHDWPTAWRDRGMRQPGDLLLGKAIEALPRQNAARRVVRGGWRQRKNEWGEYVLRRLIASPGGRDRIAAHPIVARLRELT